MAARYELIKKIDVDVLCLKRHRAKIVQKYKIDEPPIWPTYEHISSLE
jgi:hypothetical protein